MNPRTFTLAILAVSLGCASYGTPVAQTPRRDRCEARNLPADPNICDLVTTPYIRYDDPEAYVFNDIPVSLYFFSQAVPDGTEILGPVRTKGVSRVEGGSCREAGIAGLRRLQATADRSSAENGTNAVVNIRSVWKGKSVGNELVFGCKVSKGRYVVVWEAALAKVPPPPLKEETDVGKRLKELEALYYKSLITEAEFEQRRREILGEL